MSSILQKEVVSLTDIITTSTGAPQDLSDASGFSIQCVIDENTDAAKTFAADTAVAVLTDTITISAHGYPTGMKVRASSTATLPAGLATATDYFVIAVDANSMKLASSLVNALAGTAIDITDIGTAASTHTLTPTALAGATVKIQKSNDGSNWTDVAAATAITVDATVWFEVSVPQYKLVRVVYAITAGSMSVVNNYLIKRTS